MEKKKFISLFILMFILAPYLYGYECAGNTPDYIAPEYLGRGVAYCTEWRMFAGLEIVRVLIKLFVSLLTRYGFISSRLGAESYWSYGSQYILSPFIFGLIFSGVLTFFIYLIVVVLKRFGAISELVKNDK